MRFENVVTITKFALILSAVVVVQGVLSLQFQFFTYFDLPLIYSIYYGFALANPAASIAIGTVVGLMQDSFSGAVLGTNGFTKTLIGFLAASAGSRFDVDQPIVRMLAFILFTFLDFVLKVLLAFLVNPDGLGYRIFPEFWLFSGLSNALFGLILFEYRSRFRNATA